MLAIGGWDAAKEYATGLRSVRESREAGREAKSTQASKPFKQIAQELEAALTKQIYVVQVEAFGETLGSGACTGMLSRLSKALARLDPPPATDSKSLQQYMPVPAEEGEPMYIPELTAQSACYGLRGNQVACEAGVCWSVRENAKRGRRMWPPMPKPASSGGGAGSPGPAAKTEGSAAGQREAATTATSVGVGGCHVRRRGGGGRRTTSLDLTVTTPREVTRVSLSFRNAISQLLRTGTFW